jgi:hypothetical protein
MADRRPPKVDRRSKYAALGGGNLQVWGTDLPLEYEVRLRRRGHTGGGPQAPPVVTVSNDLLLESGSYLLLEDGSKLVLEP